MDTFQTLTMISNSNAVLIVCLISIIATYVFISKAPRGDGKAPPSPAGLPLIGNLHQLGSLPHRSLAALAKKWSAPVMMVRLGQSPTVVVSSAEAVKEIFQKHDVAFSDRPKSAASDVLFYEGKNIAFSKYSEEWRQARKICTVQLLSQKRVNSFGRVREEEVSKLVAEIRQHGGSPVKLSNLMMLTSNNITTRCIIGQRYSGSGFLGASAKKVTVLLVALCVGDLFPWLGWVDRVRGFTARLSATARLLDCFYSEVLEEHEQRQRQRGRREEEYVDDFADILVQLQGSGEFGYLTRVHIKAMLQDMLLAGVETSSTTMEWVMSELMSHPQEMDKVQREVRRVVGPDRDRVDVQHIPSLEYLNCVVKETLRLHPPFPLLLPRQTTATATATACEVAGCSVPPGTRVLVNAWAIHRDPATWDRPDDFIPQRFVQNPTHLKPRDSFHFIPFGFGRRECPGMAFGIINVQYLIANILYFFDWTQHHQHFDMAEANGITVSKKIPLLLLPKLHHSP